MKFTQSIAVAALAVVSVNAEIFDQAGKFAPAIIKAAVATKANKVYLRNVKTGKYLAYTRENDTPDLTFSNSPYPVDVSKIDGNKYAFGFADNRYCLSSAWNFTLGLNEYSTLYACCGDRDTCDNGSEEFGPLREAKQQLLLVPVGENALVTMVKAIVKSGIDLLKRDAFSSALTGDNFSAIQLAKKHLARRMTKRDRESRADFEKRCAKHKALELAAASASNSEDVSSAEEKPEEVKSAKKVDHKALAAKLSAQKAQEEAAAAKKEAEEEKSQKAAEAAEAAAEKAAEAKKEAAQEAAEEAAEEKAEQAKKAAAAAAAAKAAKAKAAKEEEDEEDSRPSRGSGHRNSNVIARVHMVAVDHLTDMLTRSLSCNLIMGAGDYMSVRLDVLDDNDTCQQWDVIRA